MVYLYDKMHTFSLQDEKFNKIIIIQIFLFKIFYNSKIKLKLCLNIQSYEPVIPATWNPTSESQVQGLSVQLSETLSLKQINENLIQSSVVKCFPGI